METLKIRYLSDKIEKLRFIDGKSDWIDLRSAEEVNMKAGEARLISLGIAVQLPKGYEAHVVPRSSTFKNFGLIQTNHMGVIDESYCGDHDEWKVPVMAVRDTCIHVNDRICQFRIMAHQPALVDAVLITNRSAWLNNCSNACLMSSLYIISKWEICIRCQYSTLCCIWSDQLICMLEALLNRPYTIYLTRSDTCLLYTSPSPRDCS